jgi:hypothetical protein
MVAVLGLGFRSNRLCVVEMRGVESVGSKGGLTDSRIARRGSLKLVRVTTGMLWRWYTPAEPEGQETYDNTS